MVRIGPPVQVLTILLLFYLTVQTAAPPGDRMKRLQFDAREKRLSLLEHKKRVDQNFGLDPRLEKELTGLYTKGDTYDATLFSQEHTAFKAAHNTWMPQQPHGNWHATALSCPLVRSTSQRSRRASAVSSGRSTTRRSRDDDGLSL